MHVSLYHLSPPEGLCFESHFKQSVISAWLIMFLSNYPFCIVHAFIAIIFLFFHCFSRVILHGKPVCYLVQDMAKSCKCKGVLLVPPVMLVVIN